ncbi:MAG: cystathionine beta-lyase [Pseudomonadota bacterium]
MPKQTEPPRDTLVRRGRGPDEPGRLVNLPTEQGATMLFNTMAEFEAARAERHKPGTQYYGRFSTPSRHAVETVMAELEGGADCLATSSGVSAIALALMASTAAGREVLIADNVYHNTRGFADHVLPQFGVSVRYFDPSIGEGVAALMRPETSVVMFEAPGSGTFEVPDIPAIAAAARAGGALSILDGTWATPIFCQPLTLGVDMVVHSGSKYIGGHSDTMIGFVVCSETSAAAARKMALTFGERPGSLDVTLSLRGLRTLDMRMRHAETAGMEIANWLALQPQVRRVLHPAFPDCPGHVFWKRDFSGAAGLFSVILRTEDTAKIHAFVDALALFGIGASWGGFESLVLPVVPHRTATPWTEPGGILRFGIGNETSESLIEDLAQALPLLG